MTPVGHSLFGATIALVAAPRKSTRRFKIAMISAFVVLANAPDIKVPGWGHDRYDISHSLFVNLGLIVLVGVLLRLIGRGRRLAFGRGVMIGGALAWLSHLLLDSFYNHGLGVAIYWPISSASLALPIPWFETMKKPLLSFDPQVIRVMSIELVAYGTLLAVVLFARCAFEKRSLSREVV